MEQQPITGVWAVWNIKPKGVDLQSVIRVGVCAVISPSKVDYVQIGWG